MGEFQIIIEDLELSMYLGLHDFEKKTPQKVLLSAKFFVEGVQYPDERFVDYDIIADFIRTFNGARIGTQEELTIRIHSYIIEQGAIRATVYSRKPDVYKDCKSVGVVYSG
ncbi:MAG: dihydroneopterin aldolase [Roseobacter sp.]